MSTTDQQGPGPALLDVVPEPDTPQPEAPEAPSPEAGSALSRRGFLRVSALAGLGATAATVAACTTGAAPAWTFPPAPSIEPLPTAAPTAAPTEAPPKSDTGPNYSAIEPRAADQGDDQADDAHRQQAPMVVGHISLGIASNQKKPLFFSENYLEKLGS